MEEEKIAMQAYQKKQKEIAGTQNKQRLVAAPELDAQASKMGLKGGVRGKARMIAHYEKQTTQLITLKKAQQSLLLPWFHMPYFLLIQMNSC